MRLSDVFSAKAIAAAMTSDGSNSIPFIGEIFFPTKKKMGVDLKWIKTHKGLGVALKPSTYDALATIRPREGFTVMAEEMPLFRESMVIREQDLSDIQRAQEANDPYLADVLNHLYDDAATLADGAMISAERMRMSLMAPINGDAKIDIALADNTIYSYNYDPTGEWKAKHYLALTNASDKWSAPTTAKPLEDIRKANNALAKFGYTGTYAMMTTKTFNMLIETDQMKNAFITSAGVNIDFIDVASAKELFQRKTGLTPIIYDKMFADYDSANTEKNFFPDDYVSIIGAGTLGNFWTGVTPEERSLMGDSKLDVAVMPNGIALAVATQYGPPVMHSTTASMIGLPSFEGMDKLFTIKVN